MHGVFRFLLLMFAVWSVSARTICATEPTTGEAPGDEKPFQSSAKIPWYTDYARAVTVAQAEGKMMFVFFYRPEENPLRNYFEVEILTCPAVVEKLHDYVCTKLPLGATAGRRGDEEVVVLEHPAFREMHQRQGVAILDFAHSGARYYGRVVSAFPLTEKLRYTPEQMAVILDLPPGTITQRTLIYAVRIHPERPASTRGKLDGNLLREAENHSWYQARIRLQGHHRWEARFHQINAKLPRGLTACEVCAESWPGENLVEAAIECVRSWRCSSGHWSAVRAPHRRYGYDMKRGSNGIWYATGIFGRR